MRFIILFLFVLCSFAGASSTHDLTEKSGNVRMRINSIEELRKDIDRMIKLLEENTIQSSTKMIRMYANREGLEDEFKDEETFNDFVKEFHDEYRLDVIKGLTFTKALDPKVDEKTNRYTFDLKGKDFDHDEIIFKWDARLMRFTVMN